MRNSSCSVSASIVSEGAFTDHLQGNVRDINSPTGSGKGIGGNTELTVGEVVILLNILGYTL